MQMNQYQKLARQTAVYQESTTPGVGRIAYTVLGLNGEAGEVAEKVKKLIRDDHSEITEEKRAQLKAEFGDVLWYLAMSAWEVGWTLEDVAKDNVSKLHSRMERSALHGSGDDR